MHDAPFVWLFICETELFNNTNHTFNSTINDINIHEYFWSEKGASGILSNRQSVFRLVLTTRDFTYCREWGKYC